MLQEYFVGLGDSVVVVVAAVAVAVAEIQISRSRCWQGLAVEWSARIGMASGHQHSHLCKLAIKQHQ